MNAPQNSGHNEVENLKVSRELLMPPETPQNEKPARQRYLLETLGLAHDPFATFAAEQEIRLSRSDDVGDNTPERELPLETPPFFSYYIDPTTDSPFDLPVIRRLRQARNGLIYGQPGSGKTTLRYFFEAKGRALPERTLFVTYELSDKIDQPLTAKVHSEKIAVELAKDLFIQVIEQLDVLIEPTNFQRQQLQAQMALAWPEGLGRTVKLMMSGNYSQMPDGLATLWPRLNRPIIRYVADSPQIRSFIESWLPQEAFVSGALSAPGLLTAGIKAARAWGFEQVFVLVDGVDAYERETKKMLALLAPLLVNLKQWQEQGLFFFFFLTQDVYTEVIKAYDQILKDLPFPPSIYHIIWDDDNLIKLLRQRLQAAGSRLPGFNFLAATQWKGQLEKFLARAAQNSPRHLLQLVSRLIDAHAELAAGEPLITLQDWQLMQEKWHPTGPALPPDPLNYQWTQDKPRPAKPILSSNSSESI